MILFYHLILILLSIYCRIFNKFGQSLASEREPILNTVIQWTIEMCPEYPHGHPSLHKRIGYVYWSGNLNISLQFNVVKL